MTSIMALRQKASPAGFLRDSKEPSNNKKQNFQQVYTHVSLFYSIYLNFSFVFSFIEKSHFSLTDKEMAFKSF